MADSNSTQFSHRLKDETGNVYGKLTVIRAADRRNDGLFRWVCQCECGKIAEVVGKTLRRGWQKSCGCGKSDRTNRVYVTKDEVGKVYGKLTVLELDHKHPKRGAFWKCRCECGNVVVVRGHSLRSGHTTCCSNACSKTTHGMSYSSEYKIWTNMLDRCRNSRHADYHNYGGRGIKVCEAWYTFENFYADMGNCPPGLSLDRVDVNGPYSKDNCRWATYEQQCNNCRRSILLEYQGQTLTAKQWSKKLGIGYTMILQRLKSGWPVNLALTLPPQGGVKWNERTVSPLSGI